MSTLKPVQPYAIALAAAALVVLVGCNDDRRSLPAGPSTDLAAAGVPDRGRWRAFRRWWPRSHPFESPRCHQNRVMRNWLRR